MMYLLAVTHFAIFKIQVVVQMLHFILFIELQGLKGSFVSSANHLYGTILY